MAVTYGPRPAALSGCWRTWSEQDQPQTIRSSMDSGDVKVRRRTTGRTRHAEVSVRLPVDVHADFLDWWLIYSQAGVQPTNMVEPTGQEAVWRFVEPPLIEWPEADTSFFQVSARIERLPSYQAI